MPLHLPMATPAGGDRRRAGSLDLLRDHTPPTSRHSRSPPFPPSARGIRLADPILTSRLGEQRLEPIQIESGNDTMTKPTDSQQRQYLYRMVGCLAYNPPSTSVEAAARAGGVLEDIYVPRLNFWQELDPDTVIRAFQYYVPWLDPDVMLGDWGTFRAVVENHLYIRQFDERCAMRLLALPADARPSEPEQMCDWLMADFAARGEHDYADYLDSDCKATRVILSLMYRLEEAGAGPQTTV